MMLGSKVLLLTPVTVIPKPLYVPHFFLKSLHNLPYSNGGAILYLSNKGDKHICHSEQIPISRYHLQIV